MPKTITSILQWMLLLCLLFYLFNMNNFNKYFALMALIIGGFVSFVLLVIIIFFILRLFSATLIIVPGTEIVYHFFIVIIPYIIFFSGYYYLHKKIALSTKKISRVLGSAFLVAGSLICFTTLILSLLVFLKVKGEWLRDYDDQSHYSFVIQIVLLFATALIIASGDAKEKDWMERANSNENL